MYSRTVRNLSIGIVLTVGFFGHPEVYICAPSCCLLPLSWVFTNTNSSIEILSTATLVAIDWSKSATLYITGNGGVQSEWQWSMSSVGFKNNKCLLDMSSMSKFMNLFNNFAVSYRTVFESPLSGYVLDHNVVECTFCVGISPVSTPNQGNMKLQGSNLDCGIVGTMGLPKARKSYGNGGIVVGTMLVNNSRSSLMSSGVIRNYSSLGGPGAELPKGSSLNPGKISPLIIQKCEKRVVFASLDTAKLIHVISHPDVLLLAYELIKSKPGNMTTGASKETLDGISMEWIHETSRKIKAGQYQFGLARRIMIPKVGKPGERPLTMASPREKVVQKAMALVFHEIFESKFLDYSHGFRPGRSCHSALQMVDRTFRGGKWVIEADLTKCFDRIPHKKLLDVLSRQIQCSKTLASVSSGLKAGHIFLGTVVQSGDIGTPQGSILSPLLSNIYLHELDQFMHVLVEQNTMGKTRRKNPEYRKIQAEIAKLHGNPEQQSLLRRKLWQIPSKDQMDPSFRRLAYVRYADDFVICITGPRQLAVDVLGQVERFLGEQLGLELNREKTLLTKFSDGINFLGSSITNRKIGQKPVELMTSGPAKGHLVRVSPRLSFHAPIRKLLERLVVRGYFVWSNQRAVPTAMRSLVNLDHRNILLLYNAVIRGLLNYFSFADNRKSMGTIIHGLKMSCALTLALKYKLRTASKAFKTFGSLLSCPESGVKIYLPDTFARLDHKVKFNVGGVTATPEKTIKLSYSNRMTVSSLGKPCVICGDPNVQMHHVRKLRELRSRLHLDWLTMQMAAINRKQVPLCVNHHHRLHNNLLSAQERELFRQGCENLAGNKKR
jgi:nicotine oxidoreductase